MRDMTYEKYLHLAYSSHILPCLKEVPVIIYRVDLSITTQVLFPPDQEQSHVVSTY